MKKMIFVLMVFLLASCGNATTEGSDSGDEIDYKVLITEKTLPENFSETAFRREESPHHKYLIRQAENEVEAEKWWGTYGLTEEVPSIDFSEKIVFFFGLQESGTCPVEMEDIKVNADMDMMTVTTRVSDGACTTDATPRTIVFAVDSSIAENLEVIEMQEGVSTFLPL